MDCHYHHHHYYHLQPNFHVVAECIEIRNGESLKNKQAFATYLQ